MKKKKERELQRKQQGSRDKENKEESEVLRLTGSQKDQQIIE